MAARVGPRTFVALLACTTLWLAILPQRTAAGDIPSSISWLKIPDDSAGRQDQRYHSPQCCHASDCLLQDRGQYAFVTTLRSPEYMVMLRELHCSLQRFNPGARLIVASVPGDLDASLVEEVKGMAEYRELEELAIQNDWIARFSRNWVKLRVWDWVDLDAVILLDADTVVYGELTHLFHLPTDFAMARDNGLGVDATNGGFIFLRPCRGVAQHMVRLVQEKEELQFRNKFAEQDFLEWYFKYSGMRLSSMYNSESELLRVTDHTTTGGGKPLVVHFSFDKPFDIAPDDPRWRYLCHRPQQLRLQNEVEQRQALNQELKRLVVRQRLRGFLAGERGAVGERGAEDGRAA